MNVLKILIVLIIFHNSVKAQEDFFLSKEFVDLRERPTATIIKNSTKDTLKLSGRFVTWLPTQANNFEISIPPSKRDTLKFNFPYPDFIYFYSPFEFRIFNVPGKTIHCDFINFSSAPIKINFSGEMSKINEYYLESDNHFGKGLGDFLPYRFISDTIKNFSDLPKVVDSINGNIISYLNNYNKPLPKWFKKHELWRLKYIAADVKNSSFLNAEVSKKGNTEINEDYYFDFQKSLPIVNNEMILNSEYLSYQEVYFLKKLNLDSIPKLKDLYQLTIQLIDSLWGPTDLGDIFKMRILSNMDTDAREVYANTKFYNPKTKIIFDSLINAKYGIPKVGALCPDLTLTNINGKNVSISDFKGNAIIVNFWSSSCRGCIKEFPYENKLYKKYKDKGLAVINICLETDVDSWKELSKRKELQMENLFALPDKIKTIKRKFNISAYPKSILIGPDFSVLDNNFRRASLLSEEDIKKILRK